MGRKLAKTVDDVRARIGRIAGRIAGRKLRLRAAKRPACRMCLEPGHFTRRCPLFGLDLWTNGEEVYIARGDRDAAQLQREMLTTFVSEDLRTPEMFHAGRRLVPARERRDGALHLRGRHREQRRVDPSKRPLRARLRWEARAREAGATGHAGSEVISGVCKTLE